MRSLALSEEALRLAAEEILRGEVIVYPTETLYGLAADATSRAAVERLFAVKRRPPEKPIPVIAADVDMVREMVERIPEGALRLMEKFWPGPLTLIFDARPSLPDMLTAGTSTIGIRVSSGEAARKLVEITQRPVTATSANISGAGDPSDPDSIKTDLGESVPLMINIGRMKPGPGSTVVDPRGKSPEILREGVIPAEKIIEAWNTDSGPA